MSHKMPCPEEASDICSGMVDDQQPCGSSTSDEPARIGNPTESRGSDGELAPDDSSGMSWDASEADAVAADFERAMDHQASLRTNHERVNAASAMEDNFKNKITKLETSLQEERESVTKLKLEDAKKDARVAEQMLECHKNKEKTLEAVRKELEDRCQRDLKEAEDRHTKEIKKKDDLFDWKIKEVETMKGGYLKEIEDLRDRLNELQQEIKQKEDKLRQTTDEKNSCKTELAEMREECSNLKRKLKEMEDTCEQRVKRETQYLTQEIERLRKDSAADLEKEKERYSSLSEACVRGQAMSPDDVITIRGISDGYAAMKEQLKTDFEAEIKRKKNRIDELNQRVEDAKKARDETVEQAHQHQMTQLKHDNDELVADHAEQLAGVKRKFDDKTVEYHKNMTVLTNERKRMKKELTEAKELGTELANVKDTCRKQEARIGELQDQLAKAVEERKVLSKRSMEERREIESKRDELVNKKDGKIDDLNEKFRKECASLQEEKEVHRQNLVTLYEKKLKERDGTIDGLYEKILEESKTSSQALQDEKLKFAEARAAAEKERMELLNAARAEQQGQREHIKQLEGEIRALTQGKGTDKQWFKISW